MTRPKRATMGGLDDDVVGVRELAGILDRAPHTIRMWLRDKSLPRELRPKRAGGRRQLVWPRDQIPALKKFAEERGARQGWGH